MKLTLFKYSSILFLLLNFSAQSVLANDIYMDQVGNNFELDVTQDGQNNYIGGLPGSTTPITGDGNTMTMTQQGDDMVVQGYVYGDSNTITTYQGGSADNSFMRGTVVGNNNTIDARQGKKIDGAIDWNDSGNHEQYITITGDSNNILTAQVNSNNSANSGHHMAHIITGDFNTLSHLQYADVKKNGFIEITGDDNTVTLEQRNGASHFADIVLTGDDHTVYAEQRGGMYGAHSITMDLTNAGGAYNVSVVQNSANPKTYGITGSCASNGGCGVTVTQY
tara:strand:+ start:28317 stop:29153 length:837 start_codon:yes stop_codon:yes gene_type:complete